MVYSMFVENIENCVFDILIPIMSGVYLKYCKTVLFQQGYVIFGTEIPVFRPSDYTNIFFWELLKLLKYVFFE